LNSSVIIHEASHFTAIGESKFPIYSAVAFGELILSPKAQDYAFGMAKSKDLAKTDPLKAVMNADNYEYFAETMWNIISA
jgi:Lysine-specific metallo-endopeptidase